MTHTTESRSAFEEVEEWLECKRGTLSHAFSSIPKKDVFDLHEEVTSEMSSKNSMMKLAYGGLVFGVPTTLCGLFIQVSNSSGFLTDEKMLTAAQYLTTPSAFGVLLTFASLAGVRDAEDNIRDRIADFKDRLPAHLIQ